MERSIRPSEDRDPQVGMIYPLHTSEHLQLAVRWEIFGLRPSLLAYTTVWLWEHKGMFDDVCQEGAPRVD